MRRAAVARDQGVVAAGVMALTGLAWLDVWRRAQAMGIEASAAMAMPMATPWNPGDLGVAVRMWSIMMVAMMLPSTIPMLLLFSSVQRRQLAPAAAATRTGLFVGGYLGLWIAWSLLAASLQWTLQSTLHLSPALATTGPLLGGLFLLLAGVYQFTLWKDACLAQCRSPLDFIMTRWRMGPWGAVRMGVAYGAYCIGCCWALMGLLFVAGVMNLLWIAVLAVFILLEKASAGSAWLRRGVGLTLIAWSLYVFGTGIAT